MSDTSQVLPEADLFSRDHFALFGLPRRFVIDERALEGRYHELQSAAHPDRHAHRPEQERRLSMQWATRINEGYRLLRSPLTRARYLLELEGVDVGAENNTAMPADFLMQQMAWREALDDARNAGDPEALDALSATLRAARSGAESQLVRELDEEHNLSAAAATVRRMMFIARLGEDIAAAHEKLEN
ncbi:Fe-S protein assembly co-chaperone HscB [Methyloversatilis thermotolerans]|uniref:Fe-S protein assembly co-chaperone HscB n=1 Tax=Methyloversatilis thermotolerans TaxID=1346290 RepID=UPI00037D6FA2|nr:Fe-S protein assembly co-chaperone HscB [Methyloversatilis thermotolerans]